MGSQVNFYMVREDEEEFCKFVLTCSTVGILKAGDFEQPFVPVALPLPPASEPYCGGLVFGNADVVNKEQITPRNKVRAIGRPEGIYDINAMVYPVIDFNRSIPQADGLAPGRIWAEFNRYDVPKDRLKMARAWFQQLARWLNKWPYRCDMYRIGPKTKEYYDKGGKAVGFGLGQVTDIKRTGDVSVVRRGVRVDTFSPDIERDDGMSDLTIELEP